MQRTYSFFRNSIITTTSRKHYGQCKAEKKAVVTGIASVTQGISCKLNDHLEELREAYLPVLPPALQVPRAAQELNKQPCKESTASSYPERVLVFLVRKLGSFLVAQRDLFFNCLDNKVSEKKKVSQARNPALQKAGEIDLILSLLTRGI